MNPVSCFESATGGVIDTAKPTIPASLAGERIIRYMARYVSEMVFSKPARLIGRWPDHVFADYRSGDADAGADEPAPVPGYLCPVCQKGRMLPVRELPRPTVRQIMAMPFPDEAYVKKQRKRLEGKRPRRKAAEHGWPMVAPSGDLRQRLLAFGFT